jgi:hypothetical protein
MTPSRSASVCAYPYEMARTKRRTRDSDSAKRLTMSAVPSELSSSTTTISHATDDGDIAATSLSSRDSIFAASFSVGTTSANLGQSGSTGPIIPLRTSVPELADAFK